MGLRSFFVFSSALLVLILFNTALGLGLLDYWGNLGALSILKITISLVLIVFLTFILILTLRGLIMEKEIMETPRVVLNPSFLSLAMLGLCFGFIK